LKQVTDAGWKVGSFGAEGAVNVLSRIYKQAVGFEHTPFFIESLGVDDILPMSDDEGVRDRVGSDRAAIERKAYEDGFKAGERDGFELGRQKAELLFSGLAGIIGELENYKQSLYTPCVDEMKELVLAIAKKVVHRELEIKEDSVMSCVETALRSVVAGGDIAIRVNPRDLDVVRKNRPDIVRSGEGIKAVAIEGDESVTRGGCAIDTRHGEIDATIESVMEEIEARLRDAH